MRGAVCQPGCVQWVRPATCSLFKWKLLTCAANKLNFLRTEPSPSPPSGPSLYSSLLQASPVTWDSYSIWIAKFNVSFAFWPDWVSPGKGLLSFLHTLLPGLAKPPCSFHKSGNEVLPSEEGFSSTGKTKQSFLSPGHFSSCGFAAILQPLSFPCVASHVGLPLRTPARGRLLTPGWGISGWVSFQFIPQAPRIIYLWS